MILGGSIGGVIAIVGGIAFVVMVIALFADAQRIEDAIRGDLAGETGEPGVLDVDLDRGGHVVWVIDRQEIPHDPDVALDVEILDADGTEVPLRDAGNKVSYQAPGSGDELWMAARFDVERAGRYRIRAEDRGGSLAVERFGVGREPPFGHPIIFGIGAIVSFLVAVTGGSLATGMGVGAFTWAASRRKSTLAP